MKKNNNKKILEKTIGIVFALSVWQIAAMIINESILLASPAEVIIRLCSLWREPKFWQTIFFSFRKIFSGFFTGLLAGLVFSVIAACIKPVDVLIKPFVTVMKTVPVASFIVISLVWFGSDKLSSFISFIMVFPILYTNMLDGIKGTDIKLVEMASIFRVNLLKKIKFIYIPQTIDRLISGCQVALGLAWKAGIAAEVIGIPNGSIGEKLYDAKLYLDTDDLLAWTIVIILVSALFEKLFIGLLRLSYKTLRIN